MSKHLPVNREYFKHTVLYKKNFSSFCIAFLGSGLHQNKAELSPSQPLAQKFTEAAELKFRALCEKHMATGVAAAAPGEKWKGCVICISCGDDRQGFPLKPTS